MRSAAHAIAFDFDGTLVDSAPGIVHGISAALERNGIAPLMPLDRRLVGPPLPVIISQLTGSDGPDVVKAIIEDFVRIYDGGACLQAPSFPGMQRALSELRQSHRLYLFTNKRGAPTRKMLDYLGWGEYFEDIYCLDEHAECQDKTRLLAKAIESNAFIPEMTPYVGDTPADADAARVNCMPYIQVLWGYGLLPADDPAPLCRTADELLVLLGEARE